MCRILFNVSPNKSKNGEKDNRSMLPIWQQINGSALENNAIYKNSFLINVIPVHLALHYTDRCVAKPEPQSTFEYIRNIIFINIKSQLRSSYPISCILCKCWFEENYINFSYDPTTENFNFKRRAYFKREGKC